MHVYNELNPISRYGEIILLCILCQIPICQLLGVQNALCYAVNNLTHFALHIGLSSVLCEECEPSLLEKH